MMYNKNGMMGMPMSGNYKYWYGPQQYSYLQGHPYYNSKMLGMGSPSGGFHPQYPNGIMRGPPPPQHTHEGSNYNKSNDAREEGNIKNNENSKSDENNNSNDNNSS